MDRVETTQKFELLFPMQAFDCFEAAGLELIHQLTVPNPWQDQTRLPGPLFLSRLSLFASERSVLYLGACRGRRFFDSLAFSADGGFRFFPRDFCRVPARTQAVHLSCDMSWSTTQTSRLRPIARSAAQRSGSTTCGKQEVAEAYSATSPVTAAPQKIRRLPRRREAQICLRRADVSVKQNKLRPVLVAGLQKPESALNVRLQSCQRPITTRKCRR